MVTAQKLYITSVSVRKKRKMLFLGRFFSFLIVISQMDLCILPEVLVSAGVVLFYKIFILFW